MKRQCAIALTAALLAALPAAAQTAESAVHNISQRTANALAVARFELVDEAGEQEATGQAICIDAKGVFMTLVLDARVPLEVIHKVEIIPQGVVEKPIAAKLLGIDPVTGVTFIEAAGKHPWTAVKFADSSELAIGQRVISVGLFMGDVGNLPYYGIAYVSTVMQVPESLVYVTGGKLTSIGSPVFAADGRAVGIVGRQLFMNYRTVTNRGQVQMPLHGLQETSFFLPVEEFVDVLARIPAPGGTRRLPGLGVVRFTGVTDEVAKDKGLVGAGVLLEQIVPDAPADKAKIRDGDIVTGIDGQKLPQLATPELTMRNFLRALTRLPVGQRVTLSILRDKQELNVPLTLEAIPDQPHEAPRYHSPKLGFSVREKVMLDKYLLPSVPDDVPGLIVVFVQQRGPAEQGRLQAGDLITSVNDQSVKTAAGMRQVVEAALVSAPNRPINLLVRRDGQPRAISIMPPQ